VGKNRHAIECNSCGDLIYYGANCSECECVELVA